MQLPLGDKFTELLNFFICIDKVYCFLKRTKAPITISSIQSIYESLFSVGSFHVEQFRILCSLNLNLMSIRKDLGSNLEYFEYKLDSSLTDKAVSKRKQLCINNFLSYLKGKHKNVVENKWNIIKLGWHADFDVNNIDLPVIMRPSPTPTPVVIAPVDERNTTINLPGSSVSLTDILLLISSSNHDSIEALILAFRELPFYEKQISYYELIPARPAVFRQLTSTVLHPTLIGMLKQNGLNTFYSHQIEGIEALFDGKHVIITTGTSSGKSLIYNVPVIHSILSHPSMFTALYIFPTKALAQDQLKSLLKFLSFSNTTSKNISVRTYDGDTPIFDRETIRSTADIILTNPDTIHFSMLPDHKNWKSFLSKLHFIVIDESHVYKGAFGTHVSLIMKRLIRIAALYGSFPQIVCCSASISNSYRLMCDLVPMHCCSIRESKGEDDVAGGRGGNGEKEKVGANVVVVDEDGSPQGSRLILVWNPRSIDSADDEGEEVISNLQTEAGISSNVKSPSKSPAKGRSISSEPLLKSMKRKRKALGLALNEELCHENIPEFLKGCEDKHVSFPIEENGKIWWRGSKAGMKTSNGYYNEYIPVYADDGGEALVYNELQRDFAIEDASKLFTTLLGCNLRVLLFAPSRNLVETIVNRSSLEYSDVESGIIVGYRAGYSASDRRDIETNIFSGKIKGIVATNALELGVDIGDLNATIHLGYSGSSTSFWQQAGRAGRGGKPSCAVLVCFSSPADQFIAKQPEALLRGKREGVYINTNNAYALRAHLICAAKELHLNSKSLTARFSDDHLWGESYRETVESLVQEGILVRVTNNTTHAVEYKYRCRGDEPPRAAINIRQMESEVFKLVDESSGKELDCMERRRAFKDAYEGSIFLNQGKRYLVKKLDISGKTAYCTPCNLNYKTSSSCCITLKVTKIIDSKGCICIGTVTETMSQWRYKKVVSSKAVSEHDIFLPDIEIVTAAVWINIPIEYKALFSELEYVKALHTASHAILAMAPTISQCTTQELLVEHSYQDGISFPHRILVYEKRPGGVGIAESLFTDIVLLLERASALISTCKCKAGCFSCIIDSRCPMGLIYLDKGLGVKVLQLLLETLKHDSGIV